MKIKSVEKDVYFEKWKTPLGNARRIGLSGILQTAGHTHFFFTVDDDVKNLKKKKWDIHVLTIGQSWPFRVIEEGYAKCVGRYFHQDPSQGKKVSATSIIGHNTWKLWGTNFIQELDLGKGLSIYMDIPRRDIVGYLVQARNEWIEFVSGPPRWQLLKNVTIQAAIQRYLDKGYSS